MTDISNEDLLAAADVVVKAGRASTPVLREELGVGYGRAKALLEQLEHHHIVGPSDGVKPREVIVPDWNTWQPIRDEYFDADPDTQEQLRARTVPRITETMDKVVDALTDHIGRELGLLDDNEGAHPDVVGVQTSLGDPRRVFVTVHAGQLARVLAEAARFTDVSEDSEPRCWIELSVSGGWLHGMGFDGTAAGWSRAPLFDPDEMPAHYVQNGGAAAQLAAAMIHADDAKALARMVKHKGEANEFDRATVIFDPDAGTVYVERVDVEGQRDVRIELTDYRGSTLDGNEHGDPMGWMRVDQFARAFIPDDAPIGALRIHPKVLTLFTGLIDPWNDGVRFTFGRQHSNHGGRPLLVRIAGTFTGYVLSLDPNLEGASKPETDYRPFDMVDPAERDYVRPEARR